VAMGKSRSDVLLGHDVPTIGRPVSVVRDSVRGRIPVAEARARIE